MSAKPLNGAAVLVLALLAAGCYSPQRIVKYEPEDTIRPTTIGGFTLRSPATNRVATPPRAQPVPEPIPVERPSVVRPVVESERWAVIVGISDYQIPPGEGFARLPYATDDALMIVRWLKQAGWSQDHITCLTDERATERNVRVALESWLTKAGRDDLILLYWAGHGFPDPEDPEKVYFACHDTDPRIPATGFRMDRVISILKERNARNVVVMADTCHAGKLITRGNRGVSVIPSVKQMQQEGTVPKGWVFMVSADTDREAIEHSSWRNGAFTHCVLQALGGKADGFQSASHKDGAVTLGELRAYLTTAMPEETLKVLGVAKHPVITTSSGDPDIWNLILQAK